VPSGQILCLSSFTCYEQIRRFPNELSDFLEHEGSALVLGRCIHATAAFLSAKGFPDPLLSLLLNSPIRDGAPAALANRNNDRMGNAVDDVMLIRSSWMQHYGMKNRLKDRATANVRFAAITITAYRE
jgi:hypothetical protein